MRSSRIHLLFQAVPFLIAGLSAGTARAELSGANPIGRFHEVAPGIYRGQRPEEIGIDYLASQGVKTVIDLESNDDAVAAEKAVAARDGIRFIAEPMSGFWTPKDATVDAVLKLIEDPANYPVFFHCQHGQDRTGLITGLFRVESEGWEPARAYQEMRELGFHPELVFLNHYFEKRTGFED